MALLPSLFLPERLVSINNFILCTLPYFAAIIIGVFKYLSPSRASTPLSNKYSKQLEVYDAAA